MKINSRKIILIAVAVIVVLLSGFIIIKGIKIGSFELKGILGIIEKNNEIDNKNSELAKAASVTYNSKITTLETTAKELKNQKEEYDNKATLVANSAGTAYFSTTEKYEIEFLWTKLGNYAGDEGVDIKIDVKNSSESGKYDLNFTVTGSYVGITDYIYDIENDSKLGFKIEDFTMQPGVEVSSATIDNSSKSTNTQSETANIQATFSCKQININVTQTEENTNLEEDSNNTSENNIDNQTSTDITNNNETINNNNNDISS